MADPTTTTLVDVGAGRRLAVDDVGDPEGRPVVFLHGSPSCRLARPPLDDEVGQAGIRLLAFDRPGIGRSDPDPAGTAHAFADDVTAALDALGVERFAALAWSAGAIWALAMAAHDQLGPRVERLTIAAGLVPAEAFDDPKLRDLAAEKRGGLLETAAELGPDETAQLVAPMMVPYPCTMDDAREHMVALRNPVETTEIAGVPGGPEQSAAALVETVRQGLVGVERELTVQLTPLGVDLRGLTTPTRLVYGSADEICPPAFGRWFADRLANSRLEVIDGASHGLPYPHWFDLLSA